MTVNICKTNSEYTFGDLEIGQVFKYYDNHWLKIQEAGYEQNNAFNLDDYSLDYLHSNYEVFPLKSEINIYE